MTLFDRRTATVTIYQGGYLDRIRHLERLAEAAEKAHEGQPALLSEEPDYLKLAEEHDALVREAEQAAVHIVLGALPRKTWRTLAEQHPPREGNRGDAVLGVNEDTFAEALLPLSIISPGITSEDLDELSSADFLRLFSTAFALNRAPVADPKASLVSRMTPRSDETSS